MKQLTLADGRILHFAITVGSARRLKSLCKINLLQPTSYHDGQPIVSALYGDIELFVDVLYLLCVPDQQAIAPEEFAEQLPAAWQQCRDDFFQEWIDFFLAAGLADKAAAVQKTLESIKGALSETWDRLQGVSTEEHGRESIRKIDFDQLIQQEFRRMNTPQDPHAILTPSLTPGTKSNDLPESSASTPIR